MILSRLTSPEIGACAPNSIALLPVAAIEQHGHHLPVSTDTAIASEVARRAEASLPEKVVLVPTLWAGNSHHHIDFPGTLSLRSETYIAVLVDLADCLLRSGFRKVLFLNGHGGNVTPLSEALYRTTMAHRGSDEPWVVATSLWTVAAQALKSQTFMETPKITHACEYETSVMLALDETLVNMGLAKGVRTERRSRFYDPLGYEPSRVSVSETFRQMTSCGAMGEPGRATADKGRKLLDLFTASLVEFLGEFSNWDHRRSNE
jgi:creatinine amidohydrolase